MDEIEVCQRRNSIYCKYIKRLMDFMLSFVALIIFSPVILSFTVIGVIMMKGNPFFSQKRPGKDEKIFKLYKFRTMTNKKDTEGNLLPDEKRLTKYGRFLRSTSIDELPELINILKGDMSIVGPRPLLISYLPWYTEREKHRHDVRPGLSGLAQINGRNYLDWDHRLAYDVKYVENITLLGDINIILLTIKKAMKRENIAVDTGTVEPNLAKERKEKEEREKILYK